MLSSNARIVDTGMRILYVTQSYLPEMGAGPGRISELAREWVALGHEVQVLAPVPNHPTGIVPPEFRGRWLFRERDPHGVEATRTWIYTAANKGRVRRSLAFASFALASTVVGTAASKRPDVIIGSSPQLLAAFGAMSIGALRGVPWVFEVRDLWPESIVAVGAMAESSAFVKALTRLCDSMYGHAARIVVVTQTFRDILSARGIPDAKIAYVPNGVDLTRFVPAKAREEDRRELGGAARFIVSYLGTHGMAHDLGRLIDVAARLRDRQDIAFAFVGDGAERGALEERARRERLDNVRFLGVQPRGRMPALYAASDVCVVPLRKRELFKTVLPSKIFEIMAMAKPILLAVDGEARRLVEQAGAGVSIPPGDTEALHGAIERLASQPDELPGYGERGRSFVAREFDRKALARRYLDVLAEAIGAKS
jgi:glycosyltransferase involved in cell wall biosynthesis